MGRVLLSAALICGFFGMTACTCPLCPVDSVEGVGAIQPGPPGGAERGAIASVIQLVAATDGPDSPTARALDSALGSYRLVVAPFEATPGRSGIRGYVLLKDGRAALQDYFVRAAPPDSRYLAQPAIWPLIPVVYAAGYRLAHGGTWTDSLGAAHDFVLRLAGAVESGATEGSLPPSTDRAALARYLREWRRPE